MGEIIKELLSVVDEIKKQLKEDGLTQLEGELSVAIADIIKSGAPDEDLYKGILAAIFRTFDKLLVVDKDAANHLMIISLGVLQAATRTEMLYVDGKKVPGRKIYIGKKPPGERPSETEVSNTPPVDESYAIRHGDFLPYGMTVPQRKMFIALSGVASRHSEEYFREYARALYEGKSQSEAAMKAAGRDIDVTFDELCSVYFSDKSKDNGTRNRAKVVQILNELSDYFYSYTKYIKTKRGVTREERMSRLVNILGFFSKEQYDGSEKKIGVTLRLSPHILANSRYGLHVDEKELQHILTDVCGNSPVRTTAAIKILSATSIYCSDEDSILHKIGYRAHLASMAGLNKGEFEALDRRKQSSIKTDTIKSFCGLGVETDQIGYNKTKKIVSVSIGGLENIRKKYIKAEKRPEVAKISSKSWNGRKRKNT